MATQIFFNDYFEQVAKGVHQWAAHTFKLALTNTAPDAATDTALADITQITAGNGYTAGGTALANVTVTESGGTATIDADDVTFTASGGNIGPFRYIVLYNDSAASPADALISYIDYGSSYTINDGGSFTVQWNASGIQTVAEAA